MLPDGKISIDGFLCLFDVSVVPGRSLEKQVEVITAILNNVVKTKKPVVLVSIMNSLHPFNNVIVFNRLDSICYMEVLLPELFC